MIYEPKKPSFAGNAAVVIVAAVAIVLIAQLISISWVKIF